ncbi:MAG: UvrD-helicase domain-containing protein, partial [Candidatus Latescibacterota bacterium]
MEMVDPISAFTPVDADVRRRIVETLDRPLAVEAGAGTGKTTLLIARLLHALEVGAVEMPGIVAISFTEKAAAELRLRLRQALEARVSARGDDAAVCARLQAALRELHRAQISTIHAFASSILRERPAESRLDPGFRVLDELESLQLQRAFWRQWVDAELE